MNPTRATSPPSWVILLLLSVCVTLSSACGSVDDRPAAWGYISPALFQPACATSSCHSRAVAVAGLDLSDPDRGYTSLTGLWVWIVDPSGTPEQGCKPMDGKVFCQRPHRPLVTPFDPAQSRVVNMLRAQHAPRMPPDRPLPEADIRLVERWILNGAAKELSGSGWAGAAADASQESSSPDASQDASPDSRPDGIADAIAPEQVDADSKVAVSSADRAAS
jgi:hypothetical protein